MPVEITTLETEIKNAPAGSHTYWGDWTEGRSFDQRSRDETDLYHCDRSPSNLPAFSGAESGRPAWVGNDGWRAGA
ncbi:hypothetical protein [Azospirillum sp. B2RO_4]|uniref:hypothetical protein n=1 Tax=Azospirillum sp. B2RO_4 TaxID=3027796 RepID=UPI003DA88720